MKVLKENQIGIMAVVHEGRPPFGLQTYFFEDMVRSVDIDPKVMFFFSPLDWKEGESRVSGYHFIDNEWMVTEQKIPGVIYDRAFSKMKRDKEHLERIRQFLETKGKKILNPLKLANLLNNKVDFHAFLDHNDIATLATFPISAMEDELFFESLNVKSVYAKPIFGSKGKGILKIVKRDDGRITWQHGNFLKGVNTFAEHLDILSKFIANKDNYFAQETADIHLYKKAPFDIRVLVQNYGNEYKVTGKAIRIGREYGITSNLNSGGHALPMEELGQFFAEKYKYSLKELHQKINRLCLECCNVLKEEFGDFCEIGFDVLITKNRGPIILEANAKPSRWVFVKMADYLKSVGKDNSYYLDRRKETVSVPMKYAKYLLS